jgi:hypothetical protein
MTDHQPKSTRQNALPRLDELCERQHLLLVTRRCPLSLLVLPCCRPRMRDITNDHAFEGIRCRQIGAKRRTPQGAVHPPLALQAEPEESGDGVTNDRRLDIGQRLATVACCMVVVYRDIEYAEMAETAETPLQKVGLVGRSIGYRAFSTRFRFGTPGTAGMRRRVLRHEMVQGARRVWGRRCRVEPSSAMYSGNPIAWHVQAPSRLLG